MMTVEVAIAVRKSESLVKQVVIAAIVFLTPIASAAQKAPEPQPVPLAVVVKTSQFEDQAQKDRLDSARDLKAYLSKKTVRLVEAPEEAVVIVEVLGRGIEAQDTKSLQRSASGRVEQRSNKDKVLLVKLSVGDYSTEIEGRSADGEYVVTTTWSQAAILASQAIEKWVKTNRAKLP